MSASSRKQTSNAAIRMSAMGHKETSSNLDLCAQKHGDLEIDWQKYCDECRQLPRRL